MTPDNEPVWATTSKWMRGIKWSEQMKISTDFMLHEFFWVAYGGWIVTRILVYSIYFFYGLPASPLSVAGAYFIAFWWFVFHQLTQKLMESRGKTLSSLMDLNDAMFKDMEAQRRYMVTRESMHD